MDLCRVPIGICGRATASRPPIVSQSRKPAAARRKPRLPAKSCIFASVRDPAAPYYGTAPLKRSSLTAGMLNAVESALAEIFENAPIGARSCLIRNRPTPTTTTLGRSFRGQRGRVLLRELVQVTRGGRSGAGDAIGNRPTYRRTWKNRWRPNRWRRRVTRSAAPLVSCRTVQRRHDRADGSRGATSPCPMDVAADRCAPGGGSDREVRQRGTIDLMRPLHAYDAAAGRERSWQSRRRLRWRSRAMCRPAT